MPTEEQVDVLG